FRTKPKKPGTRNQDDRCLQHRMRADHAVCQLQERPPAPDAVRIRSSHQDRQGRHRFIVGASQIDLSPTGRDEANTWPPQRFDPRFIMP
ncbi:hypothetical protein CEE86_12130, partial [Lactobacillus crispatus]